MTTTTKPAHKPNVILKLPTSVALLIAYGITVVKHMTGNPSFPNPTPPLAQITTALDDLAAAETAAMGRSKGAVTDAQREEGCARHAAEAAPGVHPVGGRRRTRGERAVDHRERRRLRPQGADAPARTFTATAGPVSGTATLRIASVDPRASYEWQYSADGGKTWLAAPGTLQTKTTIPGLAPGANVQFRYRALTRTGEGDWSQPVALVIS